MDPIRGTRGGENASDRMSLRLRKVLKDQMLTYEIRIN